MIGRHVIKALAVFSALILLQAGDAFAQEGSGLPAIGTSGGSATGRPGYATVQVDLGSGARLSFLARVGSQLSPVAKAGTTDVPGFVDLAHVFVPEAHDHFNVTISTLRAGFAAEAPAVSEQLLMERGYEIVGAAHGSLTSADAWGKASADSPAATGGKAAKIARSLCQTRGDSVGCLLLQGDGADADQFDAQAEVLKGSLNIEGGAKQGFAADEIGRLSLPLGTEAPLELDYPSAFTVAANDFGRALPGTLQLEQGSSANPSSVVMLAASAGGAPAEAKAVDAIAGQLAGNWLKQNAGLFTHPVLATKGDLKGLAKGEIGRSYSFVVDKRAGDGGQAQIRISLFASGGLRYSVLMVTNYAPKVDAPGPFLVRLAGVTGYDLVMRSILERAHQTAESQN